MFLKNIIAKKLVTYLLSLNSPYKNIIVIALDYILLTFSFWLSLSLRSNSIYIPSMESNILILVTPFVAIPIFYSFGLYKSIIRYANVQSFLTIMKAVSAYTVFWFFVVISINLVDKPYDFLIINWLVTIFFVSGIRYIAQEILRTSFFSKNVAIYSFLELHIDVFKFSKVTLLLFKNCILISQPK